MKNTISRGRLLAGAAFGLGLALAPQQAQAQCVVSGTTVVCGPTSTSNTAYPTNAPNDRGYPPGAWTSLDVSTGALVDTYGLAIGTTDPGGITVTNNGTIQVNTGLTPGVSPSGAAMYIDFYAAGANGLYQGAGDIIDLGNGNALEISNFSTTGTSTATVGGNVRADNGSAIVLTGGSSGLSTVTTTAGKTVLAGNGDGINVAQTGTGAIQITNAATIGSSPIALNTLQSGIVATQSGTDGNISVANSGAIGTAGDRAQVNGITASITNAASAGATSVTGSGAIFSVDDGIRASTAGTGSVTVNYTGAINATTGDGIDVDTTTGNISVTTGAGAISGGFNGISSLTNTGTNTVTTGAGAVTGASFGVQAVSNGVAPGLQTVNANGVVTGTASSGIRSFSNGARTINIGTAGNVTGGVQALELVGPGTATINNSGIVGAASTGLALLTSGTGAVTLTNNTSGTLNGRLLFNAGNDGMTNSGTWNTQGITDFGAGTDALTNNASGIINLTGATTLANLETFTQNGRINLNTFVLTGPPIAFTNNGTIDTNGNAGLGGFTSFNNAGTLDLAAGTFTVPVAVFTNSGLILADEGATTITGQTSFANSGTLDLQDGVANDVLTINSNFAGSGGSSLLIDFSGTASDRLVINGAASGTTSVGAAYLGGGFNLDGLLVVDTVSSSANAFVLGSVTGETPLLAVDLEQRGADYFLVAAPTEAAFNPLVVPGFATDLWYQSANEIFAETVKPATTSGISFWGEGYISRDKYGDDDDTVVVDGIAFDVDNEVKTKRHGLQMGVDYGFGGGRVGLTGGYAWAKANGNADADLKAKGWNLGIYGQFGGLTGFHGEFLAKHDRYKAKFTDGAFDDEKFDIRATGIDGSLGYRFGMGGAMTMDIHGGLSHVRTKVDDINAFGFNYDIAKLTSTRGRAGVRAILGGGMAPYVDATVYREFKGGGDVELFDGFNAYDLDTRGKGTWVRLEAGLSGNDGPGPILAAWGDLGDRKGIGLRAGWRLGGRVAEALPPPPPMVSAPPPPPPPPATQTCPDGSVILATDMCPPPPPPPPPPPEPERG